ncbi:hypothetical protein R3P38DRAFT_2806485 [Favolaschia claudopus]|uniref:Uncharacterized protein n=1 Tax=Favolaschia claudopus TaxID=2862362 RepID=A0AAV9ZJT3_9AGAR
MLGLDVPLNGVRVSATRLRARSDRRHHDTGTPQARKGGDSRLTRLARPQRGTEALACGGEGSASKGPPVLRCASPTSTLARTNRKDPSGALEHERTCETAGGRRKLPAGEKQHLKRPNCGKRARWERDGGCNGDSDGVREGRRQREECVGESNTARRGGCRETGSVALTEGRRRKSGAGNWDSSPWCGVDSGGETSAKVETVAWSRANCEDGSGASDRGGKARGRVGDRQSDNGSMRGRETGEKTKANQEASASDSQTSGIRLEADVTEVIQRGWTCEATRRTEGVRYLLAPETAVEVTKRRRARHGKRRESSLVSFSTSSIQHSVFAEAGSRRERTSERDGKRGRHGLVDDNGVRNDGSGGRIEASGGVGERGGRRTTFVAGGYGGRGVRRAKVVNWVRTELDDKVMQDWYVVMSWSSSPFGRVVVERKKDLFTLCIIHGSSTPSELTSTDNNEWKIKPSATQRSGAQGPSLKSELTPSAELKDRMKKVREANVAPHLTTSGMREMSVALGSSQTVGYCIEEVVSAKSGALGDVKVQEGFWPLEVETVLRS